MCVCVCVCNEKCNASCSALSVPSREEASRVVKLHLRTERRKRTRRIRITPDVSYHTLNDCPYLQESSNDAVAKTKTSQAIPTVNQSSQTGHTIVLINLD